MQTERRVQLYVGAVVIVAVALYTVSCFLPATDICNFSDGPSRPSLGLEHLLLGWCDVKGIPAWSANLVLWAGIVCLLRFHFRAAAVLGVMATLLGLTTLVSFKHDGRYVGYYLWQLSQIVFAVGAICAVCRPTTESQVTGDRG